MRLNIKSKDEFKGFKLGNDLHSEENIIVITGKNGSGKSRFLESIKNNASEAYMENRLLNSREIEFLEQSQLKPDFGAQYDEGQYQAKLVTALQMFDKIKQYLDKPLTDDLLRTLSRIGHDGGSLSTFLHNLCGSIAKKIGKQPSELSHDELLVYFEDHIQTLLGFQNLSQLCNRYIEKRKRNRYYRYLATQEGEELPFLSDDEFIVNFGEQPWDIINKIIESIFDHKFQFTTPDIKSYSYPYLAQLRHKESDEVVAINNLSSGERTLLWLAITLFNSQYYDSSIIASPKLLLLDEPDAFLHPQMVLRLYQTLNEFCSKFDAKIILTTHSPTTIALAPDDGIFVISPAEIKRIDKDSAIATLLDGVSQISIDPENRRQVFVESIYDANIYQAIFTKLINTSSKINPKISLSFISAGGKVHENLLADKVRQILSITDQALIDDFVAQVNGVGGCANVIGQVESLANNNNKTIRGIIDWDLKNHPRKNILVCGYEYCYSIENLILDPPSILLLLYIDKSLSFKEVCNEDVDWQCWLQSTALMQESIDSFFFRLFSKKSNHDVALEYSSGLSLLFDKQYLTKQGHDLEQLLLQKYPELNAYRVKGKDDGLKMAIVNKAMIRLSNGLFIPKSFETVFEQVQKES